MVREIFIIFLQQTSYYMITIFCCSSIFSVTVADSIGVASSTEIEVSIVGFSSTVVSSIFVVVVVISGNCKKIQC